MLKKHLEFSILFSLIFVTQLIIELDPKTSFIILGNFIYLLKGLITISLMLYVVFKTKLNGRFAKRIMGALFFGLIGDILLMFVATNANYFLFGLIAFLIGHLLYISAFYIDFKWNPTIEKGANRLALLVCGTVCITFYLFLRPHLNEMKIPVLVYVFVISLMVIMAVNRKGRVGTLSFKLIFLGAVIFVISDSLIAYNKFINPFKGAGFAIMFTYMLAQYLITIGAIERKLKKSIAIDPSNQ